MPYLLPYMATLPATGERRTSEIVMRDATAVLPPVMPGPTGTRRRRSTEADPLKKITLRLHERVAVAVRALVDTGAAPSTDAFVEDAIIAALRERRRQRLYAAYAEAALDAAFQDDMATTTRAFDVALADGLSHAAAAAR